jgi:hypothetical protein
LYIKFGREKQAFLLACRPGPLHSSNILATGGGLGCKAFTSFGDTRQWNGSWGALLKPLKYKAINSGELSSQPCSSLSLNEKIIFLMLVVNFRF